MVSLSNHAAVDERIWSPCFDKLSVRVLAPLRKLPCHRPAVRLGDEQLFNGHAEVEMREISAALADKLNAERHSGCAEAVRQGRGGDTQQGPRNAGSGISGSFAHERSLAKRRQ